MGFARPRVRLTWHVVIATTRVSVSGAKLQSASEMKFSRVKSEGIDGLVSELVSSIE